MPRTDIFLRAKPSMLLVVCLCSIWFSLEAGATDNPVGTDYLLQTWQVEDGLPHNIVRQIFQDREGYLWLATAGGLARFDGVRFKEFPFPSLPRRRVHSVRAILQESPDTLLVLVDSSSLLRFQNGEFKWHPANAQLGLHEIATLFLERRGPLWASYVNGEIKRWEKGQTITFGSRDGLNGGRWSSFANDESNGVWIASGSFLGHFHEGALVKFSPPAGSNLRIVGSRSGGVWILSNERLQSLERGELTTRAKRRNELGLVETMFEDREGTLWIGTETRGLFRFANGEFIHVPTSHQQVIALAQDEEGSLWAGTRGGGLNRLRPKVFRLYDGKAGLLEDVSLSVCEDRAGDIWFGNFGGGSARLRGGNIEVLRQRTGWPNFAVVSICPDLRGDLWLATSTGIYRVPQDRPDAPQRMGSATLRASQLFTSRTGDVWIGNDPDVLGRFQGEKFQRFSEQDGFSGRRIRVIGEDLSGRIWIGTEDGELFEFCENRFKRFTVADGLPGSVIGAICPVAEDLLLIGTAGGGLVLRQAGRFARITSVEGLPDDVIAQIIEDDHGQIWFGSRRGMFHAAKEDILKFAQGRIRKLNTVSFGKSEGLSGITCIEGYQPAVWKAHDGKLWFATRKGVLAIDPVAESASTKPPPVHLEKFLLDDQPAPLSGASINVPPGRRKLEFRFAVLSYAAPENVQVRYKLENFDADWLDAGAQRFASYPKLPPGKYCFRVMGCNSHAVWNESGATLAFTVVPAWWQTRWFTALGALSGLMIVGGTVRFFEKRKLQRRMELLEKERAVERERARIAKDMHDDLGANLTLIALLSELAQSDFSEPEQAREHINQIFTTARTLTRSLDEIVWAVNPANDLLENFLIYICKFAQDYLRVAGIRCRLDVPDFLPSEPVSAAARHHLYLATKEALHNIVKHSAASEVWLKLKLQDNSLTLIIEDNGKGFVRVDASPACLPPGGAGDGLGNMRIRLEEVGGRFEQQSEPGEGTTTTLSVPLSVIKPRR